MEYALVFSCLLGELRAFSYRLLCFSPLIHSEDFSTVPQNATFEDVRRLAFDGQVGGQEGGETLRPSHDEEQENGQRRRGPSQDSLFPTKLHQVLARPELSHIITWMPEGRSWNVVNKRAFEEEIIPVYFHQTKYASFTRQVNGWGFKRIMTDDRRGLVYYHEAFLRGKEHLAKFMRRRCAGGTRNGDEINHIMQRPDFSLFPPLPPRLASEMRQPNLGEVELRLSTPPEQESMHHQDVPQAHRMPPLPPLDGPHLLETPNENHAIQGTNRRTILEGQVHSVGPPQHFLFTEPQQLYQAESEQQRTSEEAYIFTDEDLVRALETMFDMGML